MDQGEPDPIERRPERSRRDILKAGASAVPVIMTLHAAPAWGATDYTRVAYRYGMNVGKCRNPNFVAGSNAPGKREEFIPCDTGTGTRPKDGVKI